MTISKADKNVGKQTISDTVRGFSLEIYIKKLTLWLSSSSSKYFSQENNVSIAISNLAKQKESSYTPNKTYRSPNFSHLTTWHLQIPNCSRKKLDYPWSLLFLTSSSQLNKSFQLYLQNLSQIHPLLSSPLSTL